MSHHQRKEMIRCADSGHVSRIKRLLDAGAETEFVANSGMSPLMTASYAGHTDVVSMLLNAGASIHLAASDGASALHWAARNGHHEIVTLLLDAGADVNAQREPPGPTPLHFAIGNGHDAVAISLIEAGTSLDTKYLDCDIYQYAGWHGRTVVSQYLSQLPGRPTWFLR
ncbi:MAG: ankyrin repeat protein [Planctomycetaceae bacterium]|jgi:ankyrin repeat protein